MLDVFGRSEGEGGIHEVFIDAIDNDAYGADIDGDLVVADCILMTAGDEK